MATEDVSRTLVEAMKWKYEEDAEDETFMFGSKKVELVGMGQVLAKTNLTQIRSASLSECGVFSAGPPDEIRTSCPRITELCLAKSRFPEGKGSWELVFTVVEQLKALSIMDLGCNPQLGEAQGELEEMCKQQDEFPSLKHLVLNATGCGWSAVQSLASVLPNLGEIHLEKNGITTLQTAKAPTVFKSLSCVNLTDNSLSDWSALDCLAKEKAPLLRGLILAENNFTELPPNGENFSGLTSLMLEKNAIQGQDQLLRLTKLPDLKDLRIGPLDPKLAAVAQSRSFIIPRVPSLVRLNGAAVTAVERKDMETFYIRQSSLILRKEHKLECHVDDCSEVPKAFMDLNPWYPVLVAKHGNPMPPRKPGEEDNQEETATYITVTLADRRVTKLGGAGDTPTETKSQFSKKLPSFSTVAELKSLLAKKFGLQALNQRLVARSKPSGGEISYSTDLDDDNMELVFYSIMDGATIEMYERDLKKEAEEREAQQKAVREREEEQLRIANAAVDRQRARQFA